MKKTTKQDKLLRKYRALKRFREKSITEYSKNPIYSLNPTVYVVFVFVLIGLGALAMLTSIAYIFYLDAALFMLWLTSLTFPPFSKAIDKLVMKKLNNIEKELEKTDIFCLTQNIVNEAVEETEMTKNNEKLANKDLKNKKTDKINELNTKNDTTDLGL